MLKHLGIRDVVYIHLEYPGGVMANIRVSWLDPNKTRRITIVGSKKMLVYDDVSSLEKIKLFDKGVEMPDYAMSYQEFECSYRYGDVTIPHIQWIEPLRVECQHFIDCIQNDFTPQSDGECGMKVVEVLEAADESLRASATVSMAEDSTWQEVRSNTA